LYEIDAKPVKIHRIKMMNLLELNPLSLVVFLFLLTTITSCNSLKKEEMTEIKVYNPEGLHANPAFSQIAIIPSNARQILIGGQNALNSNGEIVGKGDLKRQAEQILKNIKIALTSANAELDHIVKWNIYVIRGTNIQPAFEVFQTEMKNMRRPPLITMLFVDALAHPDFLMEVEVVAAIAE
jgi:enamine deaminase RidA (YjgF/YER057c/UK114 family)